MYVRDSRWFQAAQFPGATGCERLHGPHGASLCSISEISSSDKDAAGRLDAPGDTWSCRDIWWLKTKTKHET